MSSPRHLKTTGTNQDPELQEGSLSEPTEYPVATTPDFYPVSQPSTPSFVVVGAESLSDLEMDLQISKEEVADTDVTFDLDEQPLVPPKAPVLKPKPDFSLGRQEGPMPEFKMYNDSLAPLQPLAPKKKEKEKGRSTLDEEKMKELLQAFQPRSSRRNTILFAFNSNPEVGSPEGSPRSSIYNRNTLSPALFSATPASSRPVLPAINALLFQRAPLSSAYNDLARRRGERLLSLNRQNHVERGSESSTSTFTPRPPGKLG